MSWRLAAVRTCSTALSLSCAEGVVPSIPRVTVQVRVPAPSVTRRSSESISTRYWGDVGNPAADATRMEVVELSIAPSKTVLDRFAYCSTTVLALHLRVEAQWSK